jgi:hypothetical protein
VTGGESASPPSWEELLTGAHPSFRSASAAGAWRGLARHERGDWSADAEPLDPADLAPCPENDDMGWGEAVAWTVVAAGVAAALTSRLGGILP